MVLMVFLLLVIVVTMFQVVFVLLLDFNRSLFLMEFFRCHDNRSQNLTIFLVIFLVIGIITVSVS